MINRPLMNIDDLKRQVQPYDFYLREQGLCRLGFRTRQWIVAGLCPFHEDHSAGSFKVNVYSRAFTCFSCGAKGGDIIAFVQQKYRLSLKEAVEKLSYDWGVRC